jgi:phosphohistidine phosphatase
MVKRLVLLRHAKSSWDDPTLADRDRPLNRRGKRSAKAVGKWLTGLGIVPDLILCSDAVRTLETHKRLKIGGELRVLPELYHADADTMMAAMQQAAGTTVMMIAHNPGVADFARRIVATPPPHGRFGDFPTAATLIVEIPMVDWEAGHFGSSRVVNFITPRELIGNGDD